MTQDVLLAKIASIERCLARIRSVAGAGEQSLESLDTQEIVILNLQRAIQAAIDLAAHILSAHQWGLPDSLKAHFTLLEQHGVIDRELSLHLQAMVGFRNIAVHDYGVIDLEILKRIVSSRLVDLDNFVAAAKTSFA